MCKVETICHNLLFFFNFYFCLFTFFRRKKIRDEVSAYDRFNIQMFLKLFPDPDKHFSQIEKQRVFNENENPQDIEYACNFLYNKYQHHRKHTIDLLFKWKKRNLFEICEQLDRMPRQLRIKRVPVSMGKTSNIPLLQLVSLCYLYILLTHCLINGRENFHLACGDIILMIYNHFVKPREQEMTQTSDYF